MNVSIAWQSCTADARARWGIGCVILFSCWLPPARAVGAEPAGALPTPASHAVDFAREIQPILARACFDCHGPQKQEAGLRLDQRDDALKGSDNGPVIKPGKSADSLLVQAISWTRDDLKMPKKGERLSAEQVGLIRAWIDQGAPWPAAIAATNRASAHWAFTAPGRPALPSIKDQKWPRTPIDHFVLARMEKEKLRPSPETDRATLLRRLCLDLTGLPPTIQEVDAFMADKSADAYEKQVERLLASPHYGERWGRHWLDAARYADSDGFEKDKSRNVWFYRDWVINAFNADLPYDQFVIQQIAGDLLPNAGQDQRVATGFLRHSMVNEEGGVDPEQFRMEAMFDRMDAIGKSILGLTIQCAQCHNHKFDPLTQEEYYRIFAFINNDHEANSVVYTPEEMMQRDRLQREMRQIETDLKHRRPQWKEEMAKWEETARSGEVEWHVVQPAVEEISTGGQKYLPQADGSFLALSYAPTKHTVRLDLTTTLTNITAIRLELLTDPNLPANGPGRSFKGTCALTEIQVEAAPASSPTNKHRLKFAGATADFNQVETPLEANFYDKSTNNRVTGPVAFAIDNNELTAWGIDAGPGRRNQERKAVFQLATNVGFAEGTLLTFQLKQNHGGWNSDDHMNNNLGRFRLSLSTQAAPVTADPLPPRARDALAIPAARRTAAQPDTLFSYWRTTVADWRADNERIEQLWKQWPTGTTQLLLLSRTTPRETRILRRGDFLKPTRPVPAGVPAFLHPLPAGANESRLTFAQWLVDRRSPTTARVIINRIWQSYFGTGMVATPEDFGMQSETPSHPELLDWLAMELMEPRAAATRRGEKPRPWSLKPIHRLLVTSATYRQVSRVSPEAYAHDPYNRFLARGPRYRVEGEIVRDITLAASGLLNPKIGGPSVFPPLPPFLVLPPASYAPFTWTDETGTNRYRRALYTFRRRSTPHPVLQNFDVPNADFSCVRRVRSNSPLQALTTLNEPLFMEAAQALALRVLAEGGSSDDQRAAYAFRRCVSRRPTPEENAELLKFFTQQKKRFAEGWAAPQLVGYGDTNHPPALPPGTTPTQLGAWTMVARVLLNLDETITKE